MYISLGLFFIIKGPEREKSLKRSLDWLESLSLGDKINWVLVRLRMQSYKQLLENNMCINFELLQIKVIKTINNFNKGTTFLSCNEGEVVSRKMTSNWHPSNH